MVTTKAIEMTPTASLTAFSLTRAASSQPTAIPTIEEGTGPAGCATKSRAGTPRR